MPHLRPDFFLRLHLPDGTALGPGKIALLEAIARTGSISAAGRELGMSYRRAWTLIEALTTSLGQPVVDTARGGPGVGGARLTATGAQLCTAYRRIVEAARQGARPELDNLAALLPAPRAPDWPSS